VTKRAVFFQWRKRYIAWKTVAGFKDISEGSLRRYDAQGVLRPLRIGGMRYYLMSDIIAAGKSASGKS